MNGLQVALLILGLILFALSFLLPMAKEEQGPDTKALINDAVKETVNKELEETKKNIELIVDEAVEYAQEKTERSLERISNEKIMAVNEYSDTVLGEINKNHQEVIFLYDMLENKNNALKESVAKANTTQKQLETDAASVNLLLAQLEEATNVATNHSSQMVEENIPFERVGLAAGDVPAFDVRMANAGRTVTDMDTMPDSVDENMSRSFSPLNGLEDVSEQQERPKKLRTLNWAAEASAAAEETEKKEKSSAFVNGFDEELRSMGLATAEQAYDTSVHQQILQMYHAGMDVVSIARKLNKGVVEVQMIIDYNKG